MKTGCLSCIVFIMGVLAAGAQGTFGNLGFESATVPDVPQGQSSGSVTLSNGIPGWKVYLGSLQPSLIAHNDQSIGNASVSIFGPQWYSNQILEGRYTVLLQAGQDPVGPVGSRVEAAIAQTGQIPTDARSMSFWVGPFSANFIVSFKGQIIPTTLLDSSSARSVYGSDITSLAGLVGELRFSAQPILPSGFNSLLLDAISFSNEPIPEPGTLGLFAFSALLLGWRFFLKQG